MSTLDRMLSVLMAAREARNGSALRLGSGEVTSTRGRRSNRRRKSATLATESLEQRQMLALTVYAQDDSGLAEDPRSWVTVVAEPGDNVFVQQVAPVAASQREALYIADNASFTNRTMVGGAIAIGSTKTQLLPGFNATELGRLTITNGYNVTDNNLLPVRYPMISSLEDEGGGWTGITIPDNFDVEFNLSNRITGFISITEPNGSPAIWAFDNAGGGTPALVSGIGITEAVAAGQYYPQQLIVSGNRLLIQWNVRQLPAVPSVYVRGVNRFDLRTVQTTQLPSADTTAVFSLSNATVQGAQSIIPSTFTGVVEIDGTRFPITAGHGSDGLDLFFQSPDGQTRRNGFWRSDLLPSDDRYVEFAHAYVSGRLIPGVPQADGTTPRRVELTTYYRPYLAYNYSSSTFRASLIEAKYAVERAGGAPVNATIWAGQDIQASVDINLTIPGSAAFIDSPIRVVDSKVRQTPNNTNAVYVHAGKVELNAVVSTPGLLRIGVSSGLSSNALGSQAYGLERASAVASISGSLVSALTVPVGSAGAGYRANTPPKVTIAPALPLQATAAISTFANGKLLEVKIVSGGFGYVTAPTVRFSDPQLPGGVRTTGVATVVNGEVTGITIINEGSGYISAPVITLTSAQSDAGPVGTGASAAPLFVGSIGSVRLISNGAGYLPNSYVDVDVISAGGGKGAQVRAVINAAGAVAQVEVANGGEGYGSGDTTVTIPAPNDPTGGKQAKASAVVDSLTGRIKSLVIDDPGSGYGQIPVVTIEAPQMVNGEIRTAVSANQLGVVSGIELVSGAGLRARVIAASAAGAITAAVVEPSGSGSRYKVGELIRIDSLASGSGQAALLRVVEVDDPKQGGVARLDVVWGGGGYKVDEVLVHDGTPNRGYGYTQAPLVWVERPQTGDGVQAEATAQLDKNGGIESLTVASGKGGRGYSSSSLPAVSVAPERPLAKAEVVTFNAPVAASVYTISLDDDRSTLAIDRSTLFVSSSALLSGTVAYERDETSTPAESVVVESHRGDVIVYGVINAAKQSYLLQSDPQDVMLFPYRFVARVPGDVPFDEELIPVMKGETVAITLANDLPTLNLLSLANGGVAANDVDLVTQIESMRVRAAWRSGAERTDPFPYTCLIEEFDDISIDALAASGWPLIFSAVGNLQTNAAIDTANDLVIRGVTSLAVTAPMRSGRNITLEAEQVAVRNSIDARDDLDISASNGNITLSGGTVTGRGAVRLKQKNTKVPKTIDFRSGSTPTALVKGKTVSVPIAVTEEFVTTDVNITLSITNPTLQYLEATLVSPSGARVPLFGQSGITGTNMKDALFNDQSSKGIREGTAPYTTIATDLAGVTTEKGFRTELQRLSNFNGYGVTGTWNLEVTVPTYGSDGTIDSVLLSLQNPAGGSSGSLTSSSTIVADGLVIDAQGDVTATTDVNTVTAVTDGNLTLDDKGAMDVTLARAGGAVWLTAAGVDPVSIDPITKSRKFGAALRATLVDVGSFFVSAPKGSVDVTVTAAKSITMAGNPSYTTDTIHGNMAAAGSVSIRSLGGSTGGDISVFDAPLAGGVDPIRQVKLATQSKLDAVYVAGTSGLYLSTLTAKQNGTLAAALGGGVSLQKDNAILIKDGTLADGTKANGIYKVVDLGSATTPWKLARSIDVDTVQEFPAGSIVKVVTAAAADTFFRIDYQTTPDKPFGYADVDVQPLTVTANIGTDDPTDTLRFVVSNDSSQERTGTTDNKSPGSLGKMIDLAQQNDTSSSASNPVQTTDFLFSTNITSGIKLKQELPLVEQPLNIDGARRWNPFTNAAESGAAVAVDGSRIDTSRTGSAVTTQTVVNGFVFTANSGGTQAGGLANMIVGGFQGAAVKIDSAPNVVVDSNWIGGSKNGTRNGNQIGVMVTGSSDKSTEGVTISNNKIGGSGVAAVSLEGKAGGVSLFGNTIGFDAGDNVIGVDVTTTGKNSIGLETRNRNVVGYNSTGIRLGVGSGDTTIENSEISYNVISGISILGGKHQIGRPNTAAARNAVFSNKGWGIRIDGKTGDSGTDVLTLANTQKIENNLFISPAAAPGDISTRNLRGAIGIRNAPLTTVGDFSLKSDGRKYEVDPITGTDSQGNQYIPLADIVGPDLTVQAARSVSGPLPSTVTSSGLTVKGSDATRVRAFVLRVADGGSGVDADTVVKEAFSLTLNGKPLTEGTDYTFSFSGGNANEVSFTCKTATGFFAQGRYVVTATGKSGTSSGLDSVTGGILTDAANNPLKGNQTGTNMASVAKFTMLLSDVPGIVTGVTPILGDASATLSWTAPQSPAGAPITTYVVEYTAAGGPWQPFPHADSTATSLIVTGLTNGVPYTFRVAAVNEAGTGTFSAASSSVTPRTLASAPQNPQATAGNTSALLAWAAPLTDGGAAITDYDIQKSTDAGKTWSDVVDGVSTSRTATVSSLTNGTAYLFRVATVTTAGRGAWTAATAPVTPFGLPEIATNLLARATEGSAVLTWTAASSNGAAISDYLIQKSTDGGTNWIDVDDGVSSAATATVSGLNNGTAYVFRVAAKSVAGTGGWTAASAAVTPLSRATAPLSLQAVAGDGQAILSWVVPVFTSGAAITDYHIQKSVNGGTTWSDVAYGVSNATTATITGLTNGTSYLFRVAAVTSVGDGAWSLVSAAVVPHGLVSVPQKIQGVGSDGQVALTWDSPASTGGMPVIDYLVQSSSDGGANWATVTDAASATTGATVTGLNNGTSYLFRVAAVTDILTSDFSSATAAIVPLAAPGAATGLRSVPGTGQIVLVWQAPTKNGGRPVTDYDIEYKAVGSVSWVPYSHVPTAATTATIVGLAANNGYVFRVTPVTEFARGLSVETTEAVVLVPQPTRVGGRAGIGSVLLTWLPPKVNRSLRVIDYRIQYSTDGGATWTTASKAASTSTRATVRGLTSGTGYIFRVAAVTARGLGAYSVSSARVIPR